MSINNVFATGKDRLKLINIQSAINSVLTDIANKLTKPSGGTNGQFLKKSSSASAGCVWADVDALPSTASASEGDVLQLDSDLNPEWAEPSGGGIQYSTTSEVDTGDKWIDDKTIYQKTFYGADWISNRVSFDLTSLNISDIISFDGVVTQASNNKVFMMYHGGSSDWASVWYEPSTCTLNVERSTSTATSFIYITIKYIKTS